MNILAIAPGLLSTGYEYFASGERRERLRGELEGYDSSEEAVDALAARLAGAKLQWPDLIALRAPYGGTRFGSPELVGERTIEELTQLVPEAPLHLPRVIEALRACLQRWDSVPVVLVFDTALFTRLPVREATYGIDPAVSRSLGVRRLGYHGIFHELALAASSSRSAPAPRRLLSICLEPQPEVAAILDGEPVMVTGGSTPLEGLPGERACGEVDPTIILILAENLRWGTEQIDQLLSRESGLRALAERAVTIGEVLDSEAPGLQLAREVLRYRILLAAGAGKATMGGIDAAAFTGRYARSGERLFAWLRERLSQSGPRSTLDRLIVVESLLRAAADQAEAALRIMRGGGARGAARGLLGR